MRSSVGWPPHWFWSSGRNLGLLGWPDDRYFERCPSLGKKYLVLWIADHPYDTFPRYAAGAQYWKKPIAIFISILHFTGTTLLPIELQRYLGEWKSMSLVSKIYRVLLSMQWTMLWTKDLQIKSLLPMRLCSSIGEGIVIYEVRGLLVQINIKGEM